MGAILTNVDIGRKIRSFRLEAGLTQEKLAEKLEITFQQVQKYERGVTKVNLMRLQQIAAILKIPVAAFFDPSQFKSYTLSEEQSQLVNLFKNLEGTVQSNVLDIVKNLSKK